MPAYSNTFPPSAIYPGDGVLVLNAESVTAPAASQRVAIGHPYVGRDAPSVRLELSFSGAPGAFEVDLQDADTDTDAAFVLVTALTAVNAGQFGFIESPVSGRFARALVKSLTNPVTVTVKLSHA